MHIFAKSAVAVGAAVGCVASASTAIAAIDVFTVSGHTLVVRTPMEQELRGSLCEPPKYSCTKVPYASSGLGGKHLSEGTELLQQMIADQSGPLIVFVYSQGGTIMTNWLIKYGEQTNRQNDITLVSIGGATHGLGGLGPASGSKSSPATPTDTGYTVIEVSREYDMESDYPTDHGNFFAVANAQAGFFRVHMDYTDVDLLDPNNLVAQVGGTTYVLIPTEHLPMLAPLRKLGLTGLEESISSWLKPLVDAGYDRSMYIPLSQAWQDGWDLPAILQAENPNLLVSSASTAGSEPILSLTADPISPSDPAFSTKRATASLTVTPEASGALDLSISPAAPDVGENPELGKHDQLVERVDTLTSAVSEPQLGGSDEEHTVTSTDSESNDVVEPLRTDQQDTVTQGTVKQETVTQGAVKQDTLEHESVNRQTSKTSETRAHKPGKRIAGVGKHRRATTIGN